MSDSLITGLIGVGSTLLVNALIFAVAYGKQVARVDRLEKDVGGILQEGSPAIRVVSTQITDLAGTLKQIQRKQEQHSEQLDGAISDYRSLLASIAERVARLEERAA